MTKLLGTKPNQAPINADLGDLAYQDGANSRIGPITVTGGNVGIGTTSPSALLDVDGTTRLGGAVTLGGTLDMNGNELITDLTQFATTDAGNSGTSTHTVAKTSLDFQSITATGDFTINVTAPDSGQILAKRRRVVMDGTGARDITVTRDGGGTLIFWPQNTSDTTTALDTTAYGAGAIFDLWFEHDGTRLVVQYQLIYAGA